MTLQYARRRRASAGRRERACIPLGTQIPCGIRMAHHTFLFSDLVGFTALTAARGDDDAADVALAFCGRVREMLTAHRAEEIKSMGDALMIRCDDAAAAIR